MTIDHVIEGHEEAHKRFGELVHAPALSDLSAIDRTFLTHMSQGDGPTRSADMQTRMGVGSSYIAVYRVRLVRACTIQPTEKYGYIGFTLPVLREYLREHAAQLIAQTDE